MAAKIQPKWVETMALHLVKREYFDPHWSKKNQAVMVYEKVHLLNIDNGERLETYVIEAKSGSKEICIYGAAAHLIQTGQRIIILSYAAIDENETNNYKPKVVHLDKNNTILD